MQRHQENEPNQKDDDDGTEAKRRYLRFTTFTLLVLIYQCMFVSFKLVQYLSPPHSTPLLSLQMNERQDGARGESECANRL